MSRHARLSRLENRIPPPPVPQQARASTGGLEAALTKIKAQSAWLETATPVELYRHCQQQIAKAQTVIAAGKVLVPDAPGALPGFAQSLADCRLAAAKSGLGSLHWDLRKAEISILKGAGHPAISELEKAHAAYSHLPWQWPYRDNVLPPEAQLQLSRITTVSNTSTSGDK